VKVGADAKGKNQGRDRFLLPGGKKGGGALAKKGTQEWEASREGRLGPVEGLLRRLKRGGGKKVVRRQGEPAIPERLNKNT